MNRSIKSLYEQCRDRELETPEFHTPNDFYGHAAILKQYANLPAGYPLKAVIEHGPFVPWWAWEVDIDSLLPVMLVSGPSRYPLLQARCNKALFSIGPVIRYAPPFLKPEMLHREKERLGRTLLVFPPHSSHRVDARYDIHGYCQRIEKIGKAFDTVLVCVYWKDVLTGAAQTYMQHGFECVTAGHMYDSRFLPRLKSIIELATIAVTNSGGTQCCACLVMDTPIFLLETEVQHTASNDDILAHDNVSPDTRQSAIRRAEITRAFTEMRSDISSDQIEVADKYWGLSEFKTPAEIGAILQMAEDIWKKGRSFFAVNANVQAEQALAYLGSKEYERALFALELAMEVSPDMPALHFGRALAQHLLGREQAAVQSLADLLKVAPGHEEGLGLLQEIRAEIADKLARLSERTAPVSPPSENGPTK